MTKGYIKLYRSILDWPLFKDARVLQLWIYLLGKARPFPTEVIADGQSVPLAKGELAFCNSVYAKEMQLGRGDVKPLLAKLEAADCITVRNHSNNHFRIISVCNWGTYQHDGGPKSAGPVANGQHPLYPAGDTPCSPEATGVRRKCAADKDLHARKNVRRGEGEKGYAPAPTVPSGGRGDGAVAPEPTVGTVAPQVRPLPVWDDSLPVVPDKVYPDSRTEGRYPENLAIYHASSYPQQCNDAINSADMEGPPLTILSGGASTRKSSFLMGFYHWVAQNVEGRAPILYSTGHDEGICYGTMESLGRDLCNHRAKGWAGYGDQRRSDALKSLATDQAHILFIDDARQRQGSHVPS